jgi:hypothetical protein
MPTYLRGVVPKGLAVAVIERATELLDLELSCEAVDDASRHVREVLKKGALETGGAELDGETQTAMIAAMGVDEPTITVVQVGVAGQLFRAEFLRRSGLAVPLLFGQETDGHKPPRYPEF